MRHTNTKFIAYFTTKTGESDARRASKGLALQEIDLVEKIDTTMLRLHIFSFALLKTYTSYSVIL